MTKTKLLFLHTYLNATGTDRLFQAIQLVRHPTQKHENHRDHEISTCQLREISSTTSDILVGGAVDKAADEEDESE